MKKSHATISNNAFYLPVPSAASRLFRTTTTSDEDNNDDRVCCYTVLLPGCHSVACPSHYIALALAVAAAAAAADAVEKLY